jgi:hypothetical protein
MLLDHRIGSATRTITGDLSIMLGRLACLDSIYFLFSCATRLTLSKLRNGNVNRLEVVSVE